MVHSLSDLLAVPGRCIHKCPLRHHAGKLLSVTACWEHVRRRVSCPELFIWDSTVLCKHWTVGGGHMLESFF